jgi:serine/threonine-protein kinase
MPQSHADHNLLFGILALQMDFIGREPLIKAMHAWVLAKHKTLGQILVEHHALSPERHTLLEALVREHLKQHSDDPQKSLASVSSLGSVRRELEQVADPDLQASLAHICSTQPPADPQATVDHSAGTPTSAGLRFRVLRPHARGGLGEVFVAHDEELHREVALKQIQTPHADDPHSRARFLLEAEITGGLEHPGIVPVYGLGTYADGRPFYAMRFIKGDTFAEAIGRFHQADVAGRDPGERALALRQLLRRFVDVCNAVGYAHARGVIHRDLKPGNAILGRYGETLVVDWGLAKPLGRLVSEQGMTEGPLQPALVSGSAPTQMGSAIGTIPYMSPEQAAGRLDELSPASDIYSLGATLYCLLSGKAPFEGNDRGILLQRVQQGEFLPPRQLKRQVPVALEAVCLKAMALRPEHRYPSARALADDIEHWLADEPVTAYRERWLARLARWARRHRPLVASAAALLQTAVLALAVGIIAVNREQKRTKEALAAESQARQRTRKALDEMSSQVIEDWLTRRGQLEPAQRAFLEKALAYYEAFAEESGHTEEVRHSVADAHLRVGKIRYRLGQHSEAEPAHRRALELYARLADDFPAEPGYRLELAQSHNNLAMLLRDTGRPKETEAAVRDALDILNKLVTDFPAVPQYREELAVSYNNLGAPLSLTGREQEAEAAYRNALAIYKPLAADFPAVPQYRLKLALSWVNLANTLQTKGRATEAEAAYREALAIQKPLATDFPGIPQYRQDLARSHTNLGNLLSTTGRAQSAESAFRDALALYKTLAAEFPTVPQYRQELAGSHNDLGILLMNMGRPKEAEAAYGEALAIQKQLAADFPAVPQYRQDLARSHTNLGILMMNLARPKEAEGAYRDALDIKKRLAADFPGVPRYRDQLAGSHMNLGILLKDTGRPKEAEAAYRDALALYTALAAAFPNVPAYRAQLARTHNNLGALLAETGRLKEAEAPCRDALALYKTLATDFPNVPEYRKELARSHMNLGEMLKDTGRAPEAEAAYCDALALYKLLTTDFPAVPDYQNDLANTMDGLAELACGRKDYRAARQLLEQARPHLQMALDAYPRRPLYRQFFCENRQQLAATLLDLGEHVSAAEAAADLARVAFEPAKDAYKAACFFSRCNPLAEQDTKLPQARRQQLAKSYSDSALAALRQAVAKAFKDADHINKNKDLDPLRTREDFRRLVDEVGAAQRKQGARP